MALRITGLAYDPWAHWEGREPSPWMAQLADGRWVALSQRRYSRADRGLDLRESAAPVSCTDRKDTADQKAVRNEAEDLVRKGQHR